LAAEPTIFFLLFQTYLKIKRGKNKASYSELTIRWLKKRLYSMLRVTLNRDWIQSLKIVTDNFNNLKRPWLGNKSPNEIRSPQDDGFIRKVRKIHECEPSIEKQLQNQLAYSGSKDESLIQANSYVMLAEKKELFSKGYAVQVKHCFN
jgi:hypothetical protein